MNITDKMEDKTMIATVTSTMFTAFLDGYQFLAEWLGIAIVFIIVDLRFGILAAKKRGEKIRGSRAVRRSVQKLMDYICWSLVSYFINLRFGLTLKVESLPIIIMFVIYALEFCSIINNYLEYKGINKRIDLSRLLTKIFSKKNADDILTETNDNNV